MSNIIGKIPVGARNKPLLFLLRQVYRFFAIFPFLVLVSVVEFFSQRFGAPASGAETYFIISSVLYPMDRPLSYGMRSIFDAAKRVEQTKQTIESIRRHHPAAKIFLAEGGVIEEIPKDIIDSVDIYFYAGKSKLVRWACGSRFKSFGETILLLRAFSKIPSSGRYFKISGRYSLNDGFDAKNWQGENFSFHYIRPDFVSTRLYSFTGNMRVKWLFALIKGLPYLPLDYPIEYLLQKFIPKNLIMPVGLAGIGGFDGVTGAPISE